MKIVNIPAAEYLFTVNPNTKNLDAKKSNVFHTTIYKALFLFKRGNPIFNRQCHSCALESKYQMNTTGNIFKTNQVSLRNIR